MVSSARTLSMVPGYDVENVTTLRSLDDAQFIASQSAGKDVVILGTSFIGWALMLNTIVRKILFSANQQC